jgi:hypothetical protein
LVLRNDFPLGEDTNDRSEIELQFRIFQCQCFQLRILGLVFAKGTAEPALNAPNFFFAIGDV